MLSILIIMFFVTLMMIFWLFFYSC